MHVRHADYIWVLFTCPSNDDNLAGKSGLRNLWRIFVMVKFIIVWTQLCMNLACGRLAESFGCCGCRASRGHSGKKAQRLHSDATACSLLRQERWWCYISKWDIWRYLTMTLVTSNCYNSSCIFGGRAPAWLISLREPVYVHFSSFLGNGFFTNMS